MSALFKDWIDTGRLLGVDDLTLDLAEASNLWNDEPSGAQVPESIAAFPHLLENDRQWLMEAPWRGVPHFRAMKLAKHLDNARRLEKAFAIMTPEEKERERRARLEDEKDLLRETREEEVRRRIEANEREEANKKGPKH